MKVKKIILLVSGLILLIIPFFINVYSIYRLVSVGIGIILITISALLNNKVNKFLVIILPILLLIIVYSLDYIKTYTLNLKSIFVLQNKINDKVSVYNSLLYRVYKCDNDYIFDNNYKKNFPCETKLIENIDINKILNEPYTSYKKYHGSFIKVTGKISKINGSSTIILKEYSLSDNSINGAVKFNDTSELIVYVSDEELAKYKIYDYITVVGLLQNYDKENNTLTLINTKIEDNNLYNNFAWEVIENSKCNKEGINYIDNYYTLCISDIFINYGFDKYELSYAIKDEKINFDDILKEAKVTNVYQDKLYELDKFDVMVCHNGKNYILTKEEEKNYTLCEE